MEACFRGMSVRGCGTWRGGCVAREASLREQFWVDRGVAQCSDHWLARALARCLEHGLAQRLARRLSRELGCQRIELSTMRRGSIALHVGTCDAQTWATAERRMSGTQHGRVSGGERTVVWIATRRGARVRWHTPGGTARICSAHDAPPGAKAGMVPEKTSQEPLRASLRARGEGKVRTPGVRHSAVRSARFSARLAPRCSRTRGRRVPNVASAGWYFASGWSPLIVPDCAPTGSRTHSLPQLPCSGSVAAHSPWEGVTLQKPPLRGRGTVYCLRCEPPPLKKVAKRSSDGLFREHSRVPKRRYMARNSGS